ncbi:glycerol kinase GlpK [Catenovulum sediminis]|uniref:ATP:glycerol 3-phosphotransferase n=1 Tax=Catenovulum sediminis TaxID=1740262 RepID=A0ABV1RD70_9ALTE|nr:glycerol kinase GlpK [Catenovulum sediminis]
MIKKWIVAFDQGTTSSRALAFDMEGHVVAKRQIETELDYPHFGRVEQSPEFIWQQQLAVFELLLRDLQAQPHDIAAIGISNQRETTVIWDKKTGQAIYPAISWQDTRTQADCQKIRNSQDASWICDKTGLLPDAYFSASKVKWILDNVEGAREQAQRGELAFGTIDSWLVWNMSGQKTHITDITNASRTMLYDIHRQVWDSDLLAYFDIPAEILPQVVDCSGELAIFEYQNSQIPICGIAGDQQAALFGQTCFHPGMAKNTYGTGCFLLMNTGKKIIRSHNQLLSTVAWRINGDIQYALEGSVFVAGSAVQWMRDALHFIDNAAESEALAQNAEESELVIVPAFSGLGAPYWQGRAKGAVFGMDFSTGQAEFCRAVLQSLAFQTADLIDAMCSDTGEPFVKLNVDGGACANGYLMQYQADILNCPVDVPLEHELTATGAAYLAGLHLKWWDMQTLAQKREIAHLYQPQITPIERQKALEKWQRAVKCTLAWADDRA